MSIHQFHLLKSASIQSRTSHVKFGSSPCIVFFLRLFCRAVCQSTAKLAPGEVTRVQNAKIALLDFDLKKFRLGMNVEIKVTETPRPCTAGSATIRTDFQRQYPDTFEGTQSSDYICQGEPVQLYTNAFDQVKLPFMKLRTALTICFPQCLRLLVSTYFPMIQ